MIAPIPLPDSANRNAFTIDALQQRLKKMGCISDLDANQWVFTGVTIDFTALYRLEEENTTWWKRLGITPSWLARLVFIYTNKINKSASTLRNSFDCISKWLFWHAERDQNQQHLSRSKKLRGTSVLTSKAELPSLFEYILMHTLSDNGRPARRLTPLSHTTSAYHTHLQDWHLILRQLGIETIGFTSAFSANVQKKAWNETIESLSAGELTYADWSKGGTFNHLTLDYGRYYIEHCHTFFSRHVSLATALKLTLRDIKVISNMAGSHLYACINAVPHFLQGRTIDQLPRGLTHRCSGHRKTSDDTLHRIQAATKSVFVGHLRSLGARETLLSPSEIQALANSFGFDASSVNEQDWLRQVITVYLQHLDSEHNPCSIETRALHDKWLSDIVGPRLGLGEDLQPLQVWLEARWKTLCEEVDTAFPSIEWFHDLGLVIREGLTSTYLNQFINRVIDAGLTYIVALTGWRESEFGWSLQDIHITRNRDLLDQHSCPWRYTVKWEVPKSYGRIKVNREITQGTFQTAQQLALLVEAGDHRPCLYPIQNKNAKKPEQSATFVKYRVQLMWRHFTEHYVPFVQLDKIDSLEELRVNAGLNALTPKEQQQLEQLAEQSLKEDWPALQQDKLLNEARRRARDEQERVTFFIDQQARRKVLERYCNNKLPEHMHRLLDKYLSEATKQDIRDRGKSGSFTSSYTREVINEIIDDCLYPTPHAFRHMWAEAVYRRFDGDAGWMIRSQFKHISQTMWLAYIRNKDNRRQHDRVKRRVISSLLSNHLRKTGKGFAGRLDILLRRVFAKTHITSSEQIDNVVVQFAEKEVQDIKANPWGFCILLKRNQHRAKCAIGGTLERQNACPGLCLGCVNNLTQEGNIQGILLGIANDVKLLQTPGVPTSWREPAIVTIRNALKHLKRLKAAPNVIESLQDALVTKGNNI